MAFVDEARIFVKAGDGGKGCESFYRNKYFRHPRPDGGNGGKGGDVIFEANSRIQTLLDYRFKQHYKAKRGGHGSSKGKTGRGGEDCVLKVPVGTLVKDAASGHVLRDLTSPGERVVVARGGSAGLGNNNRQTPAPPGQGEEKTLFLQLKLIADVGLVGFPNAGKSTLINQISKVRSRIACYPFTTRQPVLGVVQRDDGEIFIVADLPGLIEGAHLGRGLGDRFLKHAERTRVLVHMIDMAGSEGRDPLDDYRQISEELNAYSDDLMAKSRLVVANKMDLPAARENIGRFRGSFPNEDVYEISAETAENVPALVDTLYDLLDQSQQVTNHDQEVPEKN